MRSSSICHRLFSICHLPMVMAAFAATAFAIDPNPGAPVTHVNRFISLAPSGKIELDSPIIFSNPADLAALASDLSIAGGTAGVTSINGHTGALTIPLLAPTGVTAASYGDAAHAVSLTVDAYGRLSAAANVSITAPAAGITGSHTLPDGVLSANVPLLNGNVPTFTGGIEIEGDNTHPIILGGTGDLTIAPTGFLNLSSFGEMAIQGSGYVGFVNTGSVYLDGPSDFTITAGTPAHFEGNLTVDGTLTGTATGNAPAAGSGSIVTVGTLTSGATGAGFTIGLGTSTVTGTLPAARMPLGLTATPAAGNIAVGNAGGTAFANVAVSGDATLASTGAITVTKTSGSAFGTASTHPATDFLQVANVFSEISNTSQARANLGIQSARLTGDAANASTTVHVSLFSFTTASGGNYRINGVMTCVGGSSAQHPNFCLHGITVTSMKLTVWGTGSSTSSFMVGGDVTAIDTFTSVGVLSGSSVTGPVFFDCVIEGASSGTASIDFVASSAVTVTVKKNSSADCLKTN